MHSAENTSSASGNLRGLALADEADRALVERFLGEFCNPAAAGWHRVKHNASRTVFRHAVEGREVYVKHFHSRSWLHRVMRRLGISDARREMKFSLRLAACGVRTPQVLASMCSDGIEWLATRAVDPSEPASDWHARRLLEGDAGRRKIQACIVAVARMIAKMHDAGVLHEDLHCANILLQADGDEVSPVLMDLHRATHRARLSRRARAANLAQLLHDRILFTTRTERLRFLRHYLDSSRVGGTLRGWQRMVEDFARRHTRRQHAQRDRRILSRNQYFTPLKLSGGWRARVILSSKRCMAGSQAAKAFFTEKDWRTLLADPVSLLYGEDVNVVKESRSGRLVRRRIMLGGSRFDVFIKRPRRKQPWKTLLDCFRPSRPMRVFNLGHQLLARRISTALPMAALERRIGPFLVDSILITEAVEASGLDKFFQTWLSDSPQANASLDAPQRRRLAQEVLSQLGRMLQQLHDNNFAHRDLKASNVLVRYVPPGPAEIVLVDLDGLHPMFRMTAKRQFQGLMRLNVSLLQCPEVNHSGRLRMLLGYLRRPGCGRVNFKPYWRVLEEWSAKKIREQIDDRRRRQKAARRPAS